MKQFQLHHILCESAIKALEFQDKEGYFPKGHNGPWGDVDTNVRTTAHWALTTFKAYNITGEKIFLSATIKACDYLIRKEQRPYGYTFYCRTDQTGKNMCNGLIGQAWAIEPLIFIGSKLNNSEYLNVAKQVALLHKYCRRNHAWHNIEINGGNLGINQTLNQQIWFAALLLIAGKILNDKILKDLASDFFINLPSLVAYIEEKGLIKHGFESKLNTYQIIKHNLNPMRKKKVIDSDNIKLLSEGYLSFILYGLALAYEYCSEESFWKDTRIKNIVSESANYIINKFPYGHGEKTAYRWSYNPTGIEIAYALQVFQKYLNLKSAESNISIWLNKQFDFYYDFENNMLSKNTMDPSILSARLYEAVRLNNYNICI